MASFAKFVVAAGSDFYDYCLWMGVLLIGLTLLILFKFISDGFLMIGKSKSLGFFLINTDRSKKLFLINSYSRRASPISEVYSTRNDNRYLITQLIAMERVDVKVVTENEPFLLKLRRQLYERLDFVNELLETGNDLIASERLHYLMIKIIDKNIIYLCWPLFFLILFLK